MDLVVTEKQERLAVRPHGVAGRQYLQGAAAVVAHDPLRLDRDLVGQDRVRGNQLLRQIEVVAGLPLVIGQHEAIVAGRRRPTHEAVECGEDQVGGLVVLLGAADQRPVVPRRAVRVEAEENALEDVAAVVLDRRHELTPIEPPKLGQRSRRRANMRSISPVSLRGL